MKNIVLFVSVLFGMLVTSAAMIDRGNSGSAAADPFYADGLSVAGVTSSGAVFSYLASGTQVVEHGVVYGKNQKPVLGSANRVAFYQGNPKNVAASKTFFKVTAARLDPSSKYYARAYVKNAAGNIVYSNEVSFSTTQVQK